MDERGFRLHAAAMRSSPLFLLPLLFTTVTVAQQIALPNGTGHLTPASSWVVLDADAIAAASRPNDPQAEPAKDLFLATIAALRQPERKGQHVLLHAAGDTPGSLRMVNAYAAKAAASSADLLAPATAAKMRDTLLESLRDGGNEVRFDGEDHPQLFAIGSLRLRFTLTNGDASRQLHYHAVPAGSHVQYFEAMLQPDDAGGEAAVAALLRTFDGAREGSSLAGMVIGGITGALLGGLMAIWSRNRRQRMAAEQRL